MEFNSELELKEELKKFEETQKKIAKQLVLKDTIDIKNVKRVAGFDVGFVNNKCVATAVVWDLDKKEILERKFAWSKVKIPYVPGFQSVREGDAMVKVYFQLEYEPEVLIIDGHGIAHPRKCGVASYVGFKLEKPTIGIAKELLVGEVKDGKIYIDNEIRGEEFFPTKDGKPIYISVGDRLTLPTAVEIVKMASIENHKLPEAIYHAKKFAKFLVEKYLSEKEEKF